MRVSVRSQVSRCHTSFSVRGRFDPSVINGFNHEKKIPIGKKVLNSQSSTNVEETTIQNVASLVKAMITKQIFSSYSHNPVYFQGEQEDKAKKKEIEQTIEQLIMLSVETILLTTNSARQQVQIRDQRCCCGDSHNKREKNIHNQIHRTEMRSTQSDLLSNKLACLSGHICSPPGSSSYS